MIVIFNGPEGIGKSTIIRALGQRLPKSAHVDMQLLARSLNEASRTVIPLQLARENLVQVAANSVEHGFHVLVEGTFELSSDLNAASLRLAQFDPVVFRFRLRGETDSTPVRGTPRARQQAHWLDRAEGDLGFTIDTTGKSTACLVDELLEHIRRGHGLFRWPTETPTQPRIPRFRTLKETA